MKHLILLCLSVSTLFCQEPRYYTVRCTGQKHEPDPIPGMMWQTFMNMVINGFIVTQSPKNSPEQQQAVINALTTLSAFGKEFLKSTRDMNDEERTRQLEQYLHNPAFIRQCMRSCQIMRLAAMSVE